jgi:NADPH:quinone reductase-like Zn-dependent oxidoreductase
MRAVVIREHGGYERLLHEDLPVPEPGPGQVRVQVAVAGVNHLDTWVRRGVPGHEFPLPLTPGCDGAGVVDAVGEGVPSRRVGERVLIAPGYTKGPDAEVARGLDHLSSTYGIFGETIDGTNAESVVVPAHNALPIPASLDLATAAAFPLTYLTAWGMLVRRARLEAGESVLIHAAGAGVSVAAIQIARLLGARQVVATTSHPGKAEKARQMGADVVLDYTKPEWSREVKRATHGRGVDVVVDHVGQQTFEGSLRCLVKGGRYVTCGATTGPLAQIPLNLVFFKSLSVLGSTMGSLGDVHRLLDLVVAGRLKPVIDAVLPLQQVAEAHRRLEQREVFGKLLLRVQGRE